ncbi:glycogen/starch/alpha-glucan phosphorylase [Poseidonocella sedimentorum]|uniref:Alpha-1,4 glucan phosphorylase n=1 Tax=Poseidonocella sedimentorum TaxID=871652 RepID=A0A1I6DDT8_9RHOB|nr:glycogen/starch/alpha-glucan phosphorylase [Poseidonocella sedimentorum]SFR03619.1 starch phosphorylase [Poseidonocella sedimentorum]
MTQTLHAVPAGDAIDATALKADVLKHLTFTIGRAPEDAALGDWRMALSFAVRDRITESWLASERAAREAGAKRVYYLSLEFLIGRLLEDALVNLGLAEAAEVALRDLGLALGEVVADEPDAALGNGGLGRLAACFMESLATIGCPAIGYGIRYEHGLFRQQFEHGRQVELPELWLEQQHPWEFERPGSRLRVGFGGHVHQVEGRTIWHPAEEVEAEAFDTPIVGWEGQWANPLRLWSARAVYPFDLNRFNHGDFRGAAEPEALARTISRVLYPDDTTDEGKALRLKQEYFFVAASLADILCRFERDFDDLALLPEKVAIQLNDTHPAVAGPELVRLLHDERGVEFSRAVEIARGCLSYTNHTLLPEALESWSEGLFGHLLPRHLEIIERIDAEHYGAHPDRPGSIFEHGEIQMGTLSFVMAHKVNGVSALHTELMKETVFEGLHQVHPDRIVNQTNGVTPRRWLKSCNAALSDLITETIGAGWVRDLSQLERLEPHLGDGAFINRYAAAKRANKAVFSNWLAGDYGLKVDPDAMFDAQIKRIHEYKRQHLNILQTIAAWQAIHDDPQADWTPRLKIFGGKAAPGYHFAKDIIRLINDVAARLNADPVTSKYLQVIFLPNYNVSLAERIIPASDLSEQISTAGKEASGTGNMKFALNGALTIGTLDGANVEIREQVGPENFFLFGMTAAEVTARRAVPDHARRAIEGSAPLARALGALRDGTFSPDEPGRYHGIADNIAGGDHFLVASDFAAYHAAQTDVSRAYGDRETWARMAARNTARSGWFSSDRTIRGYMGEIWGAAPLID